MLLLALELAWKIILTADDTFIDFAGVIDEDFLSKITAEIENNDTK